MKKIYFIMLILASSVTGCDEHLEIAPVSSISKASFFKAPNDVAGALNGMYDIFRNQAVLNLFIWGEARSEVMTSSIAGTLGYERYYNNSMTLASPGPDWGGLYSTINAANLILKYTPTIDFPSEDEKNDAIAQAYTMRAFSYFILARTYGGVPLRLEPTEGYDPVGIQAPRATEEEVFQQIKSDLDQAVQLFSTNAVPTGRNKWSLPSANAVKADVYLWTGKRLNGGTEDFTVALNALDEVQSAAGLNLLPQFADIFKYANKGNNEIVMAIRFQVNESPSQTFAHNMYSSTTNYPAYVPQSQRDIVGVVVAGNGNVWRVSELVRNQFTDDDLRKAATYVDLQGTLPDEYYTNYGLKYAGTVESGTRYFQSDYILYRYADILLMKAEAKNALGQDPSTEMNLIRERAYGDEYSNHVFVSGTPEENDEAILQERLFEFSLEGKRWWDLVRFGKAFELVPTLQGRESESYLMYWPIGNSIRTREVLVTENPGWQ